MYKNASFIIGISKYEEFCEKVTREISAKVFPGITNHSTDRKILKIKQNIILACRNLLGMESNYELFEKLINTLVRTYVSCIANDGDPVGNTAGQCISHPITQDVLKSQHGTGKKQKESTGSLISLVRLKIHSRILKIHLENGHIPNITNVTIRIYMQDYIKQHGEKIKIFEKLLIDDQRLLSLYFIENKIEEAKIGIDDEKNRNLLESLESKKKYLDMCKKFTDEKNIKEGILENKIALKNSVSFENLTGKVLLDKFDKIKIAYEQIKNLHMEKNLNKEEDLFEISKKISDEDFRTDFLIYFSEKIFSNTKQYLLSEYEEIKMGDVISVSCGECKYTTAKTMESYDNRKNVVYLNYRDIEVGTKVYRFNLDVTRLKNSEIPPLLFFTTLKKFLSPLEIFAAIYPISEFKFDIIFDEIPDNEIQKIIDNLLNTKIKGIQGLRTVEEIKIQMSNLIKFYFYDKERDETHIFLKSRELLYFPKEEILKRIEGDLKSKDSLENPVTDADFRLIYDGKVKFLPVNYYYFNFIGVMEMETVTKELEKKLKINYDYLITNSHVDMLNTVGKVGARCIHESFCVDELNSSGNTLNYQHVSLICRHIFGKDLLPITPNGFMNGPGINVIDKLCFQGHEQNLSEEIVKGKEYNTDGLTTSIFFGKKAELGTNHPVFSLNEEEHRKNIDSYAEARKQQRYLGKYEGVTLLPIGEMKPLTEFEKNFNFPNNVNGK